ncbi:MAG: ferrous iron transport protein A [Oscillospiraceae bacterium]|nr:ferrous iron transport protein A [Oscillospiraceae bacterium]
MDMIRRLSELRQGERAVVIDVGGDMRDRLQDMGLIEGTEVACVQISPLGDPSAYLIRGAVIALREEDSCLVKCSAEDQEKGVMV